MTTNAEMAREMGVSERRFYRMKERGDVQTGHHPGRVPLTVRDGTVIMGSDAHYLPGTVSTAHRALVRLTRELHPKAVVLNGDVLDFAAISRFPAIGWEKRTTVEQEIKEAQARLAEIRAAAGRAPLVWSLGNHDARFETRLAEVAPEFARVKGIHLKDHFPHWSPCWSCWINDDVVVKHRFKGGVHAPYNNTVFSGKTLVSGHDHMLKVTPFSDYNGVRWGVDLGTMAVPYGPQFTNYTEDNPVNWQQGFGVFTFHKGRLLWPELVHVIGEGQVAFRGKVWRV